MGDEWISGFVVLLSLSVVLFRFFCFNAIGFFYFAPCSEFLGWMGSYINWIDKLNNKCSILPTVMAKIMFLP